tara:strand:- start:889 stop:1278 length:390 start_codon:yes stop_codon:yes gene_type:complete
MNTTVTKSVYTPAVTTSGVDIVYMEWDIYSQGVPRRKDYTTTAPDGAYKVRTEMFDYRAASSQSSNMRDYVTLVWETELEVKVVNGKIDPESALAAAGHLISMCGYHGRYIEVFDFDAAKNTFQMEVGS